VTGTWLGGYAAVRLVANQERLQMWALALVQLLTMGIGAVILLSPLPYLALVLWGVIGVLSGLAYGPAYALVQGLVEERLRAMVVAILFFVANLVGMGLGPQAVGLLSDGLRPLLGDESLRWAMLLSLPVLIWAAVHYWLAGCTAEADLEAVAAASTIDTSVTDNRGNPQQDAMAQW
jgi:MFS family permease